MPSTRDLLSRFRPAGAPGAATSVGVPVDRIEDRALELAPVFQLLEDTVSEATKIRREAAVEAERRRQRAREAAVARVATARLDAESIRAQTLAEAQHVASETAHQSAERASETAQAIGDRARRALDADVAEVVARVSTAVAAVPERPSP